MHLAIGPALKTKYIAIDVLVITMAAKSDDKTPTTDFINASGSVDYGAIIVSNNGVNCDLVCDIRTASYIWITPVNHRFSIDL